MANENDVMDANMAIEMDKLSLYERFLDEVVYFLRDHPKVDSLSAAVELIDGCVDIYCKKLVYKIKAKPYSAIHNYVLSVMKRNDFVDDLKNFSDPIETHLEAKRICDDIDSIVLEDVKKVLSEHKEGYLGILFLLTFMTSLKNKPSIEGIAGSLAVFTAISNMSLLDAKCYFTSEEYAKIANKKISAKGQQDRWDEHNEETMDIVVDVIRRMINGDKRLHDKIVREVVDEYNAPIKNLIISDLIKEYPSKDIDAEEMKKYKKELNKRTHGKIVSYGKVKKMIYPLAVALEQANAPKKNSV